MSYKLLLADDSITIQKVVELTLTEEGFDVTAVGDGEAALEKARTLVPDIVLADVFMPKMDGYELCERLKADPALKGIPVILLAGTFEEFDEVKARRVGASDNLTKPFESNDLISKVKRLVEEGGAVEALAAEPFEEATLAEEVMEAAPVDAADDLWSVVDMASGSQPLAGATQVLSEEDLWKRANLLSDSGDSATRPEPEEDLPWGSVGVAEPVPAAPVDELEEDETEKTAILNMDDLHASAYGGFADEEELPAVELSEVSAPVEITPFERLEEAVETQGYTRPAPPMPPPPPAMSADAMRAEVARVAGDIIESRVKEALSGISREMIEQIVWEVVPELAEEIITREIGKLRAGIG